MSIRIVLVDDHAILRQGLQSLLAQEHDIEVVAEVTDGRQAIAVAQEKTPHVMVMDLAMPGMNGVEATRRITSESPKTKVLCLSMHAEEQFVLAALRAGASGYLLKGASSEELVRAIRALADGHKYVSPAISETVLGALCTTAPANHGSSLSRLTAREREILQLLAEGHSTKEIALHLDVSAKTVATHRENLMKKVEIETIAGLTKYAIRHGLTTSDRR